MDCTLEVVVVPVADVDRATDFHADRLGFVMDHPHMPPGDPDGTSWAVQQISSRS